MAAVENGCARGCGVCPVAVCPLRRPQTGEFGKKVLTVNSLEEVPKKFKGIITFNPVRQGGSESPIKTSEKTCSICKESASTCGHSKSKTSALAAA